MRLTMRYRWLLLAGLFLGAMAAASGLTCSGAGVSGCETRGVVSGLLSVTGPGNVVLHETAYITEAPVTDSSSWQERTIAAGTKRSASEVWSGSSDTAAVFVEGTGTVDVSGLESGTYVLLLWGCRTDVSSPDSNTCGWTRPQVFDTGSPTCSTDSCTWVTTGSCGDASCSESMVPQERQCSDGDCELRTRCVEDSSCETGGNGCSTDTDCSGDTVCNTDINQCVSQIDQCTLLRANGPRSENADILFIGKDYDDTATLENDVAYYLDYPHQSDGPSGLFNQPPMASHVDRFNVWTLNAGDELPDYGDGLFRQVSEWNAKCPFQDFSVVMADGDAGAPSSRATGETMLMVEAHQDVVNNEAPAGLAHEWGHHFGGLKDEYYSEKTVESGSGGTLTEWRFSTGERVQPGETIAIIQDDLGQRHEVTWGGSSKKFLWEKHADVGGIVPPDGTVATLGGRDAPPSEETVQQLVEQERLVNCVDTREQAERVWGHLTDEDGIGYYRGCGYNHLNWRPHPGSIMGNGGLADYGGVGNRMMMEVLNNYG